MAQVEPKSKSKNFTVHAHFCSRFFCERLDFMTPYNLRTRFFFRYPQKGSFGLRSPTGQPRISCSMITRAISSWAANAYELPLDTQSSVILVVRKVDVV